LNIFLSETITSPQEVTGGGIGSASVSYYLWVFIPSNDGYYDRSHALTKTTSSSTSHQHLYNSAVKSRNSNKISKGAHKNDIRVSAWGPVAPTLFKSPLS